MIASTRRTFIALCTAFAASQQATATTTARSSGTGYGEAGYGDGGYGGVEDTSTPIETPTPTPTPTLTPTPTPIQTSTPTPAQETPPGEDDERFLDGDGNGFGVVAALASLFAALLLSMRRRDEE